MKTQLHFTRDSVAEEANLSVTLSPPQNTYCNRLYLSLNPQQNYPAKASSTFREYLA